MAKPKETLIQTITGFRKIVDELRAGQQDFDRRLKELEDTINLLITPTDEITTSIPEESTTTELADNVHPSSSDPLPIDLPLDDAFAKLQQLADKAKTDKKK